MAEDGRIEIGFVRSVPGNTALSFKVLRAFLLLNIQRIIVRDHPEQAAVVIDNRERQHVVFHHDADGFLLIRRGEDLAGVANCARKLVGQTANTGPIRADTLRHQSTHSVVTREGYGDTVTALVSRATRITFVSPIITKPLTIGAKATLKGPCAPQKFS